MADSTKISPLDLQGGDVIERDGRHWLVHHTLPTDTGTEIHIQQLPRIHLADSFEVPYGQPIDRAFTAAEAEEFYNEVGRVIKTQKKATILWKGKFSIEWTGENTTLQINKTILNFLRDAEDPAGKVLYGEEITSNRIRVHIGLGPDHPNYPANGDGNPVPLSLLGDNIALNPTAKKAALKIIRHLIPDAVITERDGHPHLEGRLPGDDPQKWELYKELLKNAVGTNLFTIQGEWNLPKVSGYVIPHPDPNNFFSRFYAAIEQIRGEPLRAGQLEIQALEPEEGEEWKHPKDDE